MPEPTTANAPTGDVARPRRPRFVLGDMARSLGLLVAIIAVLLFIGPARSLIFPSSKDKYPTIDYSGYVRGFGDDAKVAALVPGALPSSWRANAATLHTLPNATTLHVGWSIAAERFAGLDEGVGDSSAVFLQAIQRRTLATTGTTTIAGRVWKLGRSPRGEHVLTTRVGLLLVVITGNATDEELRLLAAALR